MPRIAIHTASSRIEVRDSIRASFRVDGVESEKRVGTVSKRDASSITVGFGARGARYFKVFTLNTAENRWEHASAEGSVAVLIGG